MNGDIPLAGELEPIHNRSAIWFNIHFMLTTYQSQEFHQSE